VKDRNGCTGIYCDIYCWKCSRKKDRGRMVYQYKSKYYVCVICGYNVAGYNSEYIKRWKIYD